MTELQPLSQLQETDELSLNVQEMQFWLDKAVAWGQADSPDTRKDTCRHLSRLRNFLQQILTQINNTSSTAEIMKKFPLLGQFLGRLCWNPYVTVGETSRQLLFQCILGLYTEHPSNAVEKKANQWIQKVLCQLATEDDVAVQALTKHMGVPAKEYHVKVLQKMVMRLKENVENNHSSQSEVNQSILSGSEVFVPLATFPEASPVIGALLQQPMTSISDSLNEDFFDALSSSQSRYGLQLEKQALVSLWCHSLPSLEEAVLSLLKSVTCSGSAAPQNLEHQVTKSFLPEACAQHCSLFLVVSDIFRSVLKQNETSQPVRSVVQTVTRCVLRELSLLQPQTSLKDFFPQSPSSLLVPLLTMPSEMPQEALNNHLKWLSSSLQRLAEDGDEGCSTRGRHHLFEAWFLLVQCAHWVQMAVQLLVTSKPEDRDPLLWLLTFYHHPTNKWHQRALQLVRVREAWDHLHTLFSASVFPVPAAHLQPLITLLSVKPQQPSPAPSLTLDLLVHFAVFCRLKLNVSASILQTVVDLSGLRDGAACVLSSLHLRVQEGSCFKSGDVHLRIRELQKTITQMN
nr:Fanconi anemia group C protein [Nothobranchius furzeri]XP_015828338.2 Fanconi anemia group C protein [Nothobranchius furzeri]